MTPSTDGTDGLLAGTRMERRFDAWKQVNRGVYLTVQECVDLENDFRTALATRQTTASDEGVVERLNARFDLWKELRRGKYFTAQELFDLERDITANAAGAFAAGARMAQSNAVTPDLSMDDDAIENLVVRITEHAVMELDADEESTLQIEGFGAAVEKEIRAAFPTPEKGDAA